MIVIFFILNKKFKYNDGSYLSSINLFFGLILEFLYVDVLVGSFLCMRDVILMFSIDLEVGFSNFLNIFF